MSSGWQNRGEYDDDDDDHDVGHDGDDNDEEEMVYQVGRQENGVTVSI